MNRSVQEVSGSVLAVSELMLGDVGRKSVLVGRLSNFILW
jgi:hypothetical protein